MFSKNPNKAKNFINNINKLAQTAQPQPQNTNQKSVDERVAEGFNYAVNFYNAHPNRTLDEQWQCLAEMQNITGFDDETCAQIQSPILSILMYQETIDIANEAIQNQLRIVTDLLRNRMLELQPTLQIGVVNELPYIPKVPSKSTVVNSLDEAVKEQISSDGVYQLVNFSNKDLGYKGVEQLLYSDKGLKAIRDGSSNLSDIYQGMAAKQGVMIVQLNLSSCNIGGLGADKLGQAIHNDSGLHSLQYLNLSNNSIDDSGIYSLASNAKGNSTPSLRWLDLSNNLLTDNGANSFHWAFKENKLYNLNYLDVSENSITDKGEDLFVKVLNDPIVQDIAITIENLGRNLKLQSAKKEHVVPELHSILEKAEKRGVDVKNMVVDLSFLTWVKNIWGTTKIAGRGFVKCKWTDDPIGDWAKGKLAAKLPEKIGGIVKKTLDIESTVSCYIKACDQAATSEFGAQMAINDLYVIGENYVPENIE